MNVRLRTRPTITDYLSWSRISCFARCPRQYFFRYIERVPPSHRPVALAFGTAWHDCVGEYLEKAGKSTVEDLVEVFAESFDHELRESEVPVLVDDDETREDIVETAERMVQTFRAKVPPPDELLDRERSFSLDLVHPVTGEVLPVPVVGSIDAVVRQGNEVVLLEIKSAKRRWSAEQLETDGQVTAYQLGARELGYSSPKLELIVTTKSKKPDVQIERVVRHRADESELVELAFGVLNAIEAGVDHRLRGWQCRGCPWAEACRP